MSIGFDLMFFVVVAAYDLEASAYNLEHCEILWFFWKINEENVGILYFSSHS